MTAPQASALATVCSLFSAVLVAWITGAFDQSTALSQAEIDRLKGQAVEQIRQEGATRTEEIRQLTAKIIEEKKSEGSIKIEKFKLQRDLILEAINTKNREEAQKRLKFFAETGLIPDYAEKVLSFATQKPINDIPTLSDTQVQQLQPLGSRHKEVEGAIVELVRLSGTSKLTFCVGLAIKPNKVIAMAHCLSNEDISEYGVQYTPQNGILKTSNIVKIELVDTSGDQKISEDMAVLTTAESDVPAPELKIRKPVLGEQVFIVGKAPSSAVGYRGIARIGFSAFITENCRVIEADAYVGTDCPTTAGTSGSPIFAKKDGALLSLVAWGRGPQETNGPLLSQFEHRILELAGLGD